MRTCCRPRRCMLMLLASLAQAYAMTEASHQMTSNPLPKNGPHKPGTVGIAQGSVQVRRSMMVDVTSYAILSQTLHAAGYLLIRAPGTPISA